jgi:hypothetical protein
MTARPRPVAVSTFLEQGQEGAHAQEEGQQDVFDEDLALMARLTSSMAIP